MENDQTENKIYAKKLREYVVEAKTTIASAKKKSTKKKVTPEVVDEKLAKTLAEDIVDSVLKAAKAGELDLIYNLNSDTSNPLLDKVASNVRASLPDVMIITNFGTKEISVNWSGKNEV